MSEPIEPAETSAVEFTCPLCGQPVAFAPGEFAQRMACPHCGGEFVAPATNGSTDFPVVDDEPDRDSEGDVPEEELSALRIRQIAAGRRATYRARSYCVIAACVFAVAIVQLIWMIAQQFRAAGRWGLQCTGYLLFAILAVQGVFYFAARAARLQREAQRSAIEEFTHEPDFSTLDNGSKQVQNLEDIR